MYSGLASGEAVHATVNRWLTLSVCLRQPKLVSHDSAGAGGQVVGSGEDGGEGSAAPGAANWNPSAFRPFHTLLLLADESHVLSKLPDDCSHQLGALVRAANPLLSFREISVTTGIPLQHCFRLSAHLVFWGLARVVGTILTSNIYRVHPNARLDTATGGGSAAREFSLQFKGLRPVPLSQVLTFFRPGKRLQDILADDVPPRAHLLFIHMVIWLLQRDFLQQIRQYLFLIAPVDQVEDAVLSPAGPPGPARPTAADASPPMPPTAPSDRFDLAAADKARLALLFQRIASHLQCDPGACTGDGVAPPPGHKGESVMEIMWREHLGRHELGAVLTAYAHVLRVFWLP